MFINQHESSYQILQRGRKKLVFSLVQLYLDPKTKLDDQTALYPYILEINAGKNNVAPEKSIGAAIIIAYPTIEKAFYHYKQIEISRDRDATLAARRNYFILPIIAAVFPLFLLIWGGIVGCLLHQLTIPAIIFVFIMAAVTLFPLQYWLWSVSTNHEKTRFEKVSDLSTIIKDETFEVDTFDGHAYTPETLDAVLKHQKTIDALAIPTNRHCFWGAIASLLPYRPILSEAKNATKLKG